MKATIIVDMDGAAFEYDGTGELCRILRKATEELIAGAPLQTCNYKLRDANGNTCGRLTISGRKGR